MSFTVSNGTATFTLGQKEAIDLELKLNVTAYGHSWNYIGDALYNFGTNKPGAAALIVVSVAQYDFLEMLRLKTDVGVCRDLK